jgi:hypothetical protein
LSVNSIIFKKNAVTVFRPQETTYLQEVGKVFTDEADDAER